MSIQTRDMHASKQASNQLTFFVAFPVAECVESLSKQRMAGVLCFAVPSK